MRTSSPLNPFKRFFFLTLLAVFVLPTQAFGADWDVLWSQTYDDLNTTDSATDLFLDGNNVYAVGFKTSGSETSLIRVEKRSASTGDIIWSVENNPTSNDDLGLVVSADAQGIYIGALQDEVVEGSLTGGAWRIEKRSPSTGTLIWSQVVDPTGYSDYPVRMLVVSGKLYVLGVQGGGSGSSPPNNWRIEERSISDGTLNWSTVYKSGSDGGYPFGFGTDGVNLYTTGRYDSGDVDFQCIIEKRSISNGGVIWTKYYNPSPEQDECRDMKTDSTGLYVVGTQASNTFVQKRRFSDGEILWQGATSPGNFLGMSSVATDASNVYISRPFALERRDINNGVLLSSYNSQMIRALDADNTGYIYGIAPLFFNSNQWAIKKLGFGSPNQLPTATITDPSGSPSYTFGTPVNFAGTGTDTDGTISAYTWRDGSCSSGALLPSSATFLKSDLSVGTHLIYLTVTDNQGAVSTNCPSVTVTITQPDLKVWSIANPSGFITPTTATVGTLTPLTAPIINSGTANVTGTFQNIFQFADNDSGSNAQTPLAGTSITGLNIGISKDTTYSSWTPITAGTYYIRACADNTTTWLPLNGTVAESDEGNCGAWTPVVVSAMPILATPTISPATATYNNNISVTMTGPIGATIYHTTNGIDPTVASAQYIGPITVSTTGTTVKAKAFQSGYTDSAVASETYTLTVATPAITPATGTYSPSVTATITTTTLGDTIYYTTDGLTPTTLSSIYSSALTFTSNTTLKAKAFKTNYNSSAVATVTYTVTAPQCNDGTNNDADVWTDYPDDPGCSSLTDTDESDNPQCSDGIDNADPEDTLVDLADPGCVDRYDTDETNAPTTACNDNLDNDRDGLTDYDGNGDLSKKDPGCSGAADNNEFNLKSIRPS